MTLEDFFTLTEMKDGLTAPARVEELIAVMQKEKDCAVKNIGDATRQWSAVSSTIAATDNKDCLDLFIQLDGLWFIDRWLQDAQKFDTDSSESFVEEAITTMLAALEKLHIDNDMSTASGIGLTVKNLIGHNSSRIRDRATALCDRWKQGGTDNAIHQDIERVGASVDDVITVSAKVTIDNKPECSAVIDILPPNECAKEENCSVEPMRDAISPSKSSGGLQSKNLEDAESHTHSNHPNSYTKAGDNDPITTFQEKTSTREEPPVSTIEGTASIGSCISAPEQQSVGQIEVPNTESRKDANNFSQQYSGLRELCAGSSVLESRVHLGANVADANVSAGIPALQDNVGANEVEGVTLKSEPKSGVVDIGVPDSCNAWSSKTACQKAESCTLQESSGKEHISPIPKDAGTFSSKMGNCESTLRDEAGPPHSDSEGLDVLMKMRMEGSGSAYEEIERVSDANKDLTSTPKTAKPDTRSPDFVDKRRPDLELEYGIVDALEVARQVAQEVEREVVDYREPSCSSSSDKASEGEIAQPGSPDSIKGKEDQPNSGLPEEILARQNLSSEEHLQGEERISKSDYLDTEPESCLRDMESSQVTEAVQEPEVNSEQGGMCDFDLNQEVCSDDMDRPVSATSIPISVVSASRPAVSLGLPVAPLQFEGNLGWKGSALTSAFRPASPRRISDDGGSSNGSKCRQGLDIDLNVAEDGEEKFGDLTSGKQIQVSFALPSGESSMEISSRKSERLKLDLNCIGDYGDAPLSDFRMEGQLFHHQNGHRSPSPASSSSSMQPSMRNIDLNDRPFMQNDSSEQGLYHCKPFQNVSAYGGTRPDDPAISIMGTRVEVKRKDFIPQTISLSNGKAPEFSMDANVARTAAFLGMGPTVSYPHPPAFGYNGLAAGPALSFSSAMYGAGGSIPYMVDSRGAPVVPQVVGSASAVPPYNQQPFIMSMTSAPPGLNGVGHHRPNFDLNSGFMIEGGNRESSSLRQLFVPGPGRSIEEHLKNNSLPSSSVVGTKRKEPDAGWEPYTFNYKHQQPPWK